MPLTLFDLDNTLVDRTAAFGRAVPVLAEGYGLDPEVAVPFVIESDRDGAVGWDVWMAATIERFALDTSVDELTATFRPIYLGCYTLEPEVADGLRRLRDAGWRLGIVTNGPPSQSEKVVGTGLDRLVDAWVVSDALGVAKPDDRIFREAAHRCGTTLEGGWMIGDSAAADMAGARNAGLRSIWLHRGRTWSEPDFTPDHQADHPLAAIEMILAD